MKKLMIFLLVCLVVVDCICYFWNYFRGYIVVLGCWLEYSDYWKNNMY